MLPADASVPHPGLGQGNRPHAAPTSGSLQDRLPGRRLQPEQFLDVRPAVKALALEALPIPLEQTPAHIRIQGFPLDAEQAGRLFAVEILFPADDDHDGLPTTDPSRPPPVLSCRAILSIV